MDQSALLSLGRFWRNCFDWYTNSVPDKGLAVSKSSDHEHHEQSGGNLCSDAAGKGWQRWQSRITEEEGFSLQAGN